MQYLISVIDDESGSGTPDEMAAIDTFNEGLQANGHWVFAGGLGAPRTARAVQQMLFRLDPDRVKRVYERRDPMSLPPFEVLGDAEFVRRLLAAAREEGLLAPKVAA